MRAPAIAILTTTALLVGSVARAADSEAADVAFRRGIALMEKGAVNEACIAFEQSQRIEPKAGTLLNLAGCYERAARVEEAYRTFEAARDAARERKRADWEATATQHMKSLEAKLSRVSIDAAALGGLQDARVTVDGREVTPRELADGVAVGAGPHVVRGEASGHRPFEQTITTPPGARVTLPTLDREASATNTTTTRVGPEPARSSSSSSSTSSSVRKPLGLVLAGSGAAALAFGGVAALVANDALSDARAACPSYPDRCSAAAAEPNDRATAWSTLSTVGVASGAVLLAAGAALYFWPSAAKTVTARVGGVALTF